MRDVSVPKDGHKKIGTMIPAELYQAVSVRAVQEGTTMGGLIERALRHYLESRDS